jgi:aarF domain-containing kinase
LGKKMAICAMLLLVMTHVSVGILPLQQTVRSKYMTIEQFHDRSVSRASVGATLPLYPCSLHALRGGGPASTTMEPPDSHFRPMHTSAHAHISSDVIASEKEGLAPPTASAPVSTGSPVQEAPVKAPAATLQDFLAALGGAGNTAAKEALKPSCREDSASFGIGMSRSMLAMRVFNEVKSDYETALANISDAKLRTQALKAVHARSAPKALELARQNGGLYNKAAQLVASLQAGAGERGIPHEYVEALSVLTDKAPGKPFAEMTPVLEEEFGKPAADIFKWIDEVPLAAASLAQVHRAELHDGRRVAVKIIYPMLRKEMASDFAVLRTFAASLKPAGLDLSWLLADFEKALSKELDFEEEARNTERSARTLAHLERVKVPGVIWAYTRKSVLTMELEEGLIHLHDAQQLRAAGLNPNTVGALIADTFAEMAVVHGWVHGDPHAGNIYVRAVASASTADAGEESADPQKTAEVVMLDHGQMHELSEEARVRLCHLLLACVERRPAELQQVCAARRMLTDADGC